MTWFVNSKVRDVRIVFRFPRSTQKYIIRSCLNHLPPLAYLKVIQLSYQDLGTGSFANDQTPENAAYCVGDIIMNACAKACAADNKIDDTAHVFNGYVQMEEECEISPKCRVRVSYIQ